MLDLPLPLVADMLFASLLDWDLIPEMDTVSLPDAEDVTAVLLGCCRPDCEVRRLGKDHAAGCDAGWSAMIGCIHDSLVRIVHNRGERGY